MGIENKISKMKPKNKKLIENLLLIFVILIIAYVFFSISSSSLNMIAFMTSSTFTMSAIALIVIFVIWKVMHGGKINIPTQSETQKTKIDMPDEFGIRGKGLGLASGKFGAQKETPKKALEPPKPKLVYNYKKPIETRRIGSWSCPKCGSLVIGDICHKCGASRPR
jgi:vacuolar-type H+-ATPase subunit I/STV1